MRSCIFDTPVISMILSDKLPEKWIKHWQSIRAGNKKLILFEPLIYEVFSKNAQKYGLSRCKKKILFLKSLAQIIDLTDKEALLAGEYKIKHTECNLSLVDCFILAVSSNYGSTIVTTDDGIRHASKKIGLDIDHLPLKSR